MAESQADWFVPHRVSDLLSKKTQTNSDLFRNRKTQERTPQDLAHDSSSHLDYWCCWHLYNGLRVLPNDEVHAKVEAIDLLEFYLVSSFFSLRVPSLSTTVYGERKLSSLC